MYAYAAESLQSIWYSGASSIKFVNKVNNIFGGDGNAVG